MSFKDIFDVRTKLGSLLFYTFNFCYINYLLIELNKEAVLNIFRHSDIILPIPLHEFIIFFIINILLTLKTGRIIYYFFRGLFFTAILFIVLILIL
jgi:hypothetical protein